MSHVTRAVEIENAAPLTRPAQREGKARGAKEYGALLVADACLCCAYQFMPKLPACTCMQEVQLRGEEKRVMLQ